MMYEKESYLHKEGVVGSEIANVHQQLGTSVGVSNVPTMSYYYYYLPVYVIHMCPMRSH